MAEPHAVFYPDTEVQGGSESYDLIADLARQIFNVYRQHAAVPSKATGEISSDSSTGRHFCMALPPPLYQTHLDFVLSPLDRSPSFSSSYTSLSAATPWLIFWCLGAATAVHPTPTTSRLPLATLLGTDTIARIVRTLSSCYVRYESRRNGRTVMAGGFGGGAGQLPHLATTYAALAALCCLGHPDGYAIIKPDEIEAFLMDRRIWTVADSPVADPREVGGFTMHDGGECDTRAVYCALAAATFVGRLGPSLVDSVDGRYAGSVEAFLRSTTSLATGGSGAVAGNEAHGGYSFCALAAAHMLGVRLPRHSFETWLAAQQPAFEGGFAGRHNKLVDSCYSYWQGAVGSILAGVIDGSEAEADRRPPCFDPLGLERYILCCAQDDRGGCRDKPGKARDLYHTCYALSGLAVAHQLQPPTDRAPRASYASSVDTRTPARNVVLNVPPASLVAMHEALGLA